MNLHRGVARVSHLLFGDSTLHQFHTSNRATRISSHLLSSGKRVPDFLRPPCACFQHISASPVEEPHNEQSPDTHVLPSSEDISKKTAPPEFRFIYPEFLPDPDLTYRNKMREKLERMDMLKRRRIVDIPEFYVGTIMSVTVSDQHASGKESKFVGICIDRGGCGLRAWFTLRNVIDETGVELKYDMYNPLIKNIEVIKLERRIDPHLSYLRDAPLEYSTVPFDMEPVQLPEGAPVPLNTIKVPLRPPPWLTRWELYHFEGVIYPEKLPGRRAQRAENFKKPWEKYDLMKEYRETIPAEEQQGIYSELIDHHEEARRLRRRQLKKKVIKTPKKTV